MQIVRSWPHQVPDGRSYVVDQLPRLIVTGYDYAAALLGAADDLVLLEWDVAVDREGLNRFAKHAADDPDRIMVAPYRLYKPEPARWAHRHAGGAWISEGDPACDLFGFGMIYLPRTLVLRYLTEEHGWYRPKPGYFDSAFSEWHHKHVGPVPVLWDVRPVHLNY